VAHYLTTSFEIVTKEKAGRARLAGAQGYLVKPANFDELVAEVARLIDRGIQDRPRICMIVAYKAA
jgi:DNA-binding response OmpR family regulator